MSCEVVDQFINQTIGENYAAKYSALLLKDDGEKNYNLIDGSPKRTVNGISYFHICFLLHICALNRMLLHLINHRIRVRLEASQMQRQRKRFRSISLQTAFSARRNPALSYAEVEINCLAPSGLSLTECAATGLTYTREQQTDNYSPTFVIKKTRSEQQQHKRQAGSASRRHRPVMSASPKRARARRKRQIGLRRQESDQVSSAREHYGGKSGCAALQSVRSCVSTN